MNSQRPVGGKPTLNVSLTPEHERFIAERVASGDYQTASEVVRAALRLLRRIEGERPRAAGADGHAHQGGRPAHPIPTNGDAKPRRGRSRADGHEGEGMTRG